MIPSPIMRNIIYYRHSKDEDEEEGEEVGEDGE